MAVLFKSVHIVPGHFYTSYEKLKQAHVRATLSTIYAVSI